MRTVDLTSGYDPVLYELDMNNSSLSVDILERVIFYNKAQATCL